MRMKLVLVLPLAAAGLSGCDDVLTETRPAASSSPTTVTVAASDRGAPLTSSRFLRDVRFDCAPNDAPAVTGRWEGPKEPVTLTVVDEEGKDYDSVESRRGPFVLVLRSETLALGSAVEVQARDQQGGVRDSVRIVLRYGPRGAC